MSQVLSSQQSLEAPSRYTLFERNVFGASSPRSEKRPKTCSKKLEKAKKLKRFSEVAFAGESPNLQDVSSGILSKSKESVLVVPAEKSLRPDQPSTSRRTFGVSSPVLFDSCSGSSTPSLRVESQNVPDVQPARKVSNCAQSSPPQATQDPTVDLLMTESLVETSAVIDGQPNVLRIESSPYAVLPNATRLSRNQQIELSVRKAKEWLDNIPGDSEPVPDMGIHDNSLMSSISRRSGTPRECTEESVMIVVPKPTVKEVRILLERLDPQVLLRVPIRDIQNLMNMPSNISITNVQKTMNTLLSSNKIGLTTVDKRLMKSIQSNQGGNSVSKKTAENLGNRRRSKSSSLEEKSKGKRKLFTVQRQPSNVSQDFSVSTENVGVPCPYTPPTKKKRRALKRPCAPVKKKLQPDLGLPKPKGKRKSPLPKQKNPPKKRSPTVTQPTVVTRTRSSDVLKAQTTPQTGRSKAVPERNLGNIPGKKKSHEMTLRKKSNPRRTSLFFQPKNQVQKPKKTAKRKSTSQKHGPRVVCTFLHRGEVDFVSSVIKKLDGSMETKVSAQTTHVVCGGPKRTINLLRGIARGCWLVKYDWVVQSMEKRKWIDEEPFEVTNFSPAVQKCRIARETLGIYPTIFEKVGTIYVAPKTAPPKSELRELLELCGANVVTTTRRAIVAVGVRVPGIMSVRETWVLDSIQENLLLPLQRYLLED